MRNTITKLDGSTSLVNAFGLPMQQFSTWILQVQERGLLIDIGSPEGVIEAEQGVFYMDSTGTAGNILYIKRDANQGGDKSLGWILT